MLIYIYIKKKKKKKKKCPFIFPPLFVTLSHLSFFFLGSLDIYGHFTYPGDHTKTPQVEVAGVYLALASIPGTKFKKNRWWPGPIPKWKEIRNPNDKVLANL